MIFDSIYLVDYFYDLKDQNFWNHYLFLFFPIVKCEHHLKDKSSKREGSVAMFLFGPIRPNGSVVSEKSEVFGISISNVSTNRII